MTVSSQNRKSKSGKRTNNNKKDTSVSLKKEIILLVCLLFSILLFVSNFGIGGSFSEGLSNVFFGIFGVSAYIFPIVLTGVVFFIVSSGRIKHVTSKVISFILFILTLSSVAQLADSAHSANYDLIELFKYAMRTHSGGGFIGGIIYKILHPAIGTAGIIILTIFSVIIIGVLITGKSFLTSLFKKCSDLSSKTKNKLDDYEKKHIVQPSAPKKSVKSAEFKMPVLDNNHAEDNVSDSATDSLFINFNESKEDNNSHEALNDLTVIEKKEAKKTRKSKVKSVKDDIAEIPTEDQYSDSIEEPAVRTTKKRAGVEELKESDFNKLNSEENFKLPSINFFTKNTSTGFGNNEAKLRETALNLQNTLKSFGVNVNITDVSCGPAVTRYEFRPEAGVKVSRILSLADDIKLNLAVNDIRIEAPVPGKAAVGIEVPNATKSPVLIRDLLESDELKNAKSPLAFAAGKDVSGKVIIADLAKMPHMLVSGTTGSGKSVFTNSILMTYLYRCKPQDVRFIIIDPKVVEFGIYNGIPNLIIPVVTDPKKAAGALNWAVSEMTSRYKKFADMHVRDLESYNKCIDEKQYEFSLEEGEDAPVKLPKIVIIIDELADLMMVAAKEVEEAICRLAQLARAAGIHMIIATQRPSVDVITGLIKANIPSRVALTVASGTDSRTILDMNGAEKLLGRGDMLFYPSDYPKPLRVQGSFISDKEITDVVNFLKEQSDKPEYDENVMKLIDTATVSSPVADQQSGDDGRDELFWDAGRLICDKQKASIGSLQRVFRIGFNRAARIMDQLCEANVVGPEQGTKPREILMSLEEFELLHGGVSDTEEE